MQKQPLKILKLKPAGEKRLQRGHPWIFSNELETIDKTIPSGEICGVVTSAGASAGAGFFNSHSLIAVRLLKTGAMGLEEDFVRVRLEQAMKYRKSLNIAESGRMFFGESDGLPGLVVDKYSDILVVEIISAGAELLKDEITKQLRALYKPRGIYYRNTHEFRNLEGLRLYTETSFGDVPAAVRITENGLQYDVPLLSGQKTGWYFDQTENRAFLKPYFKGRKVLDLYTYLGAFALTAAASEAGMVWGVDSSAAAVQAAEKNAALNGLQDKVIFRKEDAERMLSGLQNEEMPEKPDFILLDPPNFVRGKKNLVQAAKLLTRLNSSAMAGLPPGGLLAFSSCSHHISREIFMDILSDAAAKARRTAVLLELRTQAKDHPILLNMPETEYLHFALIKVL
jgi:23S rRNA (cytosine1962-C5)-methyltransferase